MSGFDATANRLGALALRLTDELQAAVAPRSVSQAAALSAIRSFLDEPSVDRLAQVLGLTSSGAVRLVDGLVADGLVTRRRSGADRRTSVVALTAKGRRAADAVTDARGAVLAGLLDPLDDDDRTCFGDLLDRVLTAAVRAGSTGRGRMCRLCDTAVCGAEGRGEPCPVTVAALRPPAGP